MSEENTLQPSGSEDGAAADAGAAGKAGQESTDPAPKMPREIGGPKGPEPTRYGDWEKNGRCTDF